MTRRDLIPHFSWGPWGGDIGLDIEALGDAEAKGGALLIVWLGLCVEICIGRVTRPQR
jgi:hypothetical protein